MYIFQFVNIDEIFKQTPSRHGKLSKYFALFWQERCNFNALEQALDSSLGDIIHQTSVNKEFIMITIDRIRSWDAPKSSAIEVHNKLEKYMKLFHRCPLAWWVFYLVTKISAFYSIQRKIKSYVLYSHNDSINISNKSTYYFGLSLINSKPQRMTTSITIINISMSLL